MKKIYIDWMGPNEQKILKFLYEYNDRPYRTRQIALAIGINRENTFASLNNLCDRDYVKKNWSKKYARKRIWWLTDEESILREVEEKIGVQSNNDFEELDQVLNPIKSTMQIFFPHASLPIEFGYRFVSLLLNRNYLTNANIFRSIMSNSTEVLINNIISKPATKLIKYNTNYLEEKGIFEGLNYHLGIKSGYTDITKSFYMKSLRNSLDIIVENSVGSAISYVFRN